MPVESLDARAAALHRLRTAMIEKKMTQAELADAADCHEKTIQNLLNGRSVRDQTLFDVCMVLGLDFEILKAEWRSDGRPSADAIFGRPAVPAPKTQSGVAPLHMGAYTRAAVDHYIGSYRTIRPAFQSGDRIHAYRTDVTWDDGADCLAFAESDRADAAYAHRGHLYIPASSMFLHLVSLTKGAMRVVLLSQLDPLGRMRGIMTTLTRTRGAMFMPVAAPVVYTKTDHVDRQDVGELTPGHARYDGDRALLAETLEQGYARLQGV